MTHRLRSRESLAGEGGMDPSVFFVSLWAMCTARLLAGRRRVRNGFNPSTVEKLLFVLAHLRIQYAPAKCLNATGISPMEVW